MERKQFAAVEAIVKEGLAMGASEAFMRHVGRLQLTLLREAKEPYASAVTLERQAATLDRLARPYRPETLLKPGQIARPTPETAARAERHPMTFLPRRREWRSEYSRAAAEIVRIYQALQCGLLSGGRSLDGLNVDRSRRRFRHPIETMTEEQGRLLHDRYNPWCAEVEGVLAHRWKRGAGISESGGSASPIVRRTLLEVTMDVIADGCPINDLDDVMGLRHGSTADMVMDALRRYCVIAGWLHARPANGLSCERVQGPLDKPGEIGP